jgi:hypothetical protein
LGGNRVSVPRWYVNLFVTFLLSGLWHGANWTYLIWGALNGSYLIGEIVVARWFPRRDDRATEPSGFRPAAVARTFCLTCFAWIFFRANSVHDAFYIVGHLFDGLSSVPGQLNQRRFVKDAILMGQSKQEFLLCLFGLFVLLTVHTLQSRRSLREMLSRQSAPLRWSIYYAVIVLILFFGAFNQSQQFIYFQF